MPRWTFVVALVLFGSTLMACEGLQETTKYTYAIEHEDTNITDSVYFNLEPIDPNGLDNLDTYKDWLERFKTDNISIAVVRLGPKNKAKTFSGRVDNVSSG